MDDLKLAIYLGDAQGPAIRESDTGRLLKGLLSVDLKRHIDSAYDVVTLTIQMNASDMEIYYGRPPLPYSHVRRELLSLLERLEGND